MDPGSGTWAVGYTGTPFRGLESECDGCGHTTGYYGVGDWWDSSYSTAVSVDEYSGEISCNAAGYASISTYWDEDYSIPNTEDGSCEDLGSSTLSTSGDAYVLTISQSPSQLWYFMGNPLPSDFSLGSDTATLTANGVSSGTFVWTVTSGSGRVMFENNSFDTITKTDSNTVTISSRDWSDAMNDVTIQLQYTPPGGSAATFNWTFGVDSPYELISGGTNDDYGVDSDCLTDTSGSNGWRSLIYYYSSSRFGTPITNSYLNEDLFSRFDVISNNWAHANPGGGENHNGHFADNLCALGGNNPTPLRPQSPRSSTQVFTQQQNWYLGSTVTGNGVEEQHDVIIFYLDHGVHSSVVSPVR